MIIKSTDLALVFFACGVLLIYWELCAPGLVIPGATGLLMAISGGWTLAHYHPTEEGLAWLGAGLILQSLAVFRGWIKIVTIPLLFCWSVGLIVLLPKPNNFPLVLALPIVVLLGSTTLVLGRAAVVAHRRKRNPANIHA